MVHQIVVDTLDDQPLLHLPSQWIAQFPDTWRAEFREIAVSILELWMVNPRSPGRFRRYKIVRHNSGIWTSIPKLWLRDCSARVGDVVDIDWKDKTATLTLKRQPRP